MQPAINQTSLDARDFIKKGAQELRDQIKEKKNLPISEKEKKLLLDNLKSENREANKSEEHKNAMKQLTSDVSIIRQFGETKKGKKLNKEEFTGVKEQFYGETSEEKSKETPLKILEKERKTAAIAELERLGMKTDERVAAINAIKFENDKILIGNTPWAYENMKGGKGTFKEKTNKWYYDYKERIAEAKKQKITLPKNEDFESTFNALHLEENDTGKHILAIILGESIDGYCGSDGGLVSNGHVGSLGSVSEYYRDDARHFKFDGSKGKLSGGSKYNRFICRPLVKNS